MYTRVIEYDKALGVGCYYIIFTPVSCSGDDQWRVCGGDMVRSPCDPSYENINRSKKSKKSVVGKISVYLYYIL